MRRQGRWDGRMFRTICLTVRFIVELVIFFAFAYWGFNLDYGLIINILAGIGLPLAGTRIWGRYISPKAPVKLPGPITE
ncbi:YrdB family protein [Paenibacillus solisilvae]|uniref:YrdB family protein n=1 Tax=Paenibacillus solisilvae TaxID=2486751 RepID=A0ABW0W7I8_9BACL